MELDRKVKEKGEASREKKRIHEQGWQNRQKKKPQRRQQQRKLVTDNSVNGRIMIRKKIQIIDRKEV